jgi:hypothetical protein
MSMINLKNSVILSTDFLELADAADCMSTH